MQSAKEKIKDPSIVFTVTCALLLLLITFFGLYSMKQVKKYDYTDNKNNTNNPIKTKTHEH